MYLGYNSGRFLWYNENIEVTGTQAFTSQWVDTTKLAVQGGIR